MNQKLINFSTLQTRNNDLKAEIVEQEIERDQLNLEISLKEDEIEIIDSKFTNLEKDKDNQLKNIEKAFIVMNPLLKVFSTFIVLAVTQYYFKTQKDFIESMAVLSLYGVFVPSELIYSKSEYLETTGNVLENFAVNSRILCNEKKEEESNLEVLNNKMKLLNVSIDANKLELNRFNAYIGNNYDLLKDNVIALKGDTYTDENILNEEENNNIKANTFRRI